jgi:transcriptional repressor NrdR
MRCPNCRHAKSYVIDSRSLKDGDQIRRRRECTACKFRWTTYEAEDPSLDRAQIVLSEMKAQIVKLVTEWRI